MADSSRAISWVDGPEVQSTKIGDEMNITRIKLTDTTIDAIVKISEGNPDAVNICAQILTETEKIDPDILFGGISNLLLLDTFNIYGSEIWMLYKDVCGEDITDMLAILRGCQLGFISSSQLRNAIKNRGDGIDINIILNQVKEYLPNFIG